MNLKKNVLDRLEREGVRLLADELDKFIAKYKKQYSDKYKELQLNYEILDETDELEKFICFIKSDNRLINLKQKANDLS